MLSILIITILSGCQKKEEVSTYEQDRVAQYILDNIELVEGSETKKIKFLSFEIPPTTAQTWSIVVEINDNIKMHFGEGHLGGELSCSYSSREVKFKKMKKVKDIKNIELIYLKQEK